MTASTQLKSLLAGIATVAVIGTAMAQGNPPNPAVKNAPTGAGQQSSQQTPMGTTGTPAGGAMATGSTASSSSTSSAPMTSGTAMGSSSTSADTAVASNTTKHAKRHMRKARADRN